MKKLIYLILFITAGNFLRAQEIAISYDIQSQADNQHTLTVYLQSMSDQAKPVSAVNFSLALPAGCVKVTEHQSVFAEAWTDYLEKAESISDLDVSYGAWHYSHRWQYGNADPGLPATGPLIAPAQQAAPLKVVELKLEGTCAQHVYIEQQSENALNQIADEQFTPIKWTVIHPKTNLSLEEGLSMDIYPNPVEDVLHLSFEGEREQAFDIQLLTIDGKTVMTRSFDEKAGEILRFDMTSLPSAMYMLRISGEHTDVKQLKVLKK